MAKTIYSYLTFLSISIPLFSFAITDPHKKSLSFELIYRYSPRSPIYNLNLTNSQHFEKALQFSENRLIQLNNSESIPMDLEITSIQPNIIYYSSLYMVFITIGTGNGTIGYYLSIDTGSGITWTQCKPCINCYPQNDPYFDPDQSLPSLTSPVRTITLAHKAIIIASIVFATMRFPMLTGHTQVAHSRKTPSAFVRVMVITLSLLTGSFLAAHIVPI